MASIHVWYAADLAIIDAPNTCEGVVGWLRSGLLLSGLNPMQTVC